MRLTSDARVGASCPSEWDAGSGREVAGLQQPATEKGAAGSRWSRGQSATGCSCRGWGGGSGWREAAEAALTCPPSPPARLIQHTKDLMVSEEKLCVKVLRTLQQMLLKKTKYGDRVSWPWTKTARQSQPPSAGWTRREPPSWCVTSSPAPRTRRSSRRALAWPSACSMVAILRSR